MRRALAPLALVWLAAGCAGLPADGDGAGEDGGPMVLDDAGVPAPFEVEIGTGRETFKTLNDGDTLYLERGFQGLQHVLVSVRAPELEEARYLVDFSLTRTRDDEVVSEPSVVRLPFEASSGAGVQITGYQLVIRDPDEAVGEEAVVRMVLENDNDEHSADARTVNVAWAPDGWDPDA